MYHTYGCNLLSFVVLHEWTHTQYVMSPIRQIIIFHVAFVLLCTAWLVDSCLIQESFRISSSEASKFIQSAYDKRLNNNNNDDNDDNEEPCLVITSDASRGANRYTGLASILRHIHSSPIESGKDTVCICSRRIQTQESYDIVNSELMAILLGLRVATTLLPVTRNLLIVSDCEGALSYLQFILEQQHIVVDVAVNHNHNDDDDDNTSSSKFIPILKQLGWMDYSCRIQLAKVRSAHSSQQGFFDHEAADILSSKAKSVVNSKNNMYHKILAPALQPSDLHYLECSESMDETKNELNRFKTPVQRKKQSGARRQQCEKRMGVDWNLSVH